MFPAPFTVNGEPNPAAAFEAMFLQEAMWHQDLNALSFFLDWDKDNKAERFAWFRTPNTGDFSLKAYVPTYVVWEQRGETWVAICGTQNANQWSQHVTGYTSVVNFNGTQCKAHSGMLDVAEKVMDGVRFRYPNGFKGNVINISGHSLGGAAAHLMGCMIKRDFPGTTVNVLTLGEPMPLGKGYDGPAPDSLTCYTHGGDIITLMPPTLTFIPGYTLRTPLGRFSTRTDWTEYGTRLYFGQDGRLGYAKPASLQPTSAADITQQQWDDHAIDLYFTGLESILRRRGDYQRLNDVRRIFNGIVIGSDKNNPAPYAEWLADERDRRRLFPRQPNMNPDDLKGFRGASVRAAARVLFSGGGGSSMSDIAVWRARIKFIMGVQSWTETYYLPDKGPIPNADDPGLVQLYTLRAALLSKEVRMDSVSVKNMADMRRTAVKSLLGYHTFDANKGPAAGRLGIHNTALTINLTDRSSDYRATMYLRGWDTDMIPDDADTNRRATVKPAYEKALGAYLLHLGGKDRDQPTRFAFPAQGYKVAAGSTHKILNVYKDVAGRGYSVEADGYAPIEGQRIRVTGVRGAGIEGLNGTHTVSSVKGGLTAILNKVGKSACPVVLIRYGELYVVPDKVMQTVAHAYPGGWTTRDTGASAAAPKSRSSCCMC